MERIVQWAKDHPKLAIALVLGIVVLIYLYTRSSSATSSAATVGNTGLSSSDYAALNQSELSAATQIQGQTIAAGVATNNAQDQVQIQQLNDSTSLGIAQLQADAQNNTTYAQTQVALQTVSAQEEIALETLKANEATAADQLALEQSLVNVLAGKNNVVNPTPPSATMNPVIVSSSPLYTPGPGLGGLGAGGASDASPSGTPAPPSGPAYAINEPTGSNVHMGTLPYAPTPAVLPGTPASGYAEIPGVDYTVPNAPYAPTYTFTGAPGDSVGSNVYNPVAAATAAGAAVFNPTTGKYTYAPGVTL